MSAPRRLSDAVLIELSEFVAARLGLHFPVQRWADLERGLLGAANELGVANDEAFARRLLSDALSREELDSLANHLTVRETYFFRDRAVFDALEQQILPGLIRARAGRQRPLRIWSAGCSTGEEAYSIAMLLDRLLPGGASFAVTILATDVSAGALAKASQAEYGEWSFRGVSESVRAQYFERRTDGRSRLKDDLRRRVTFRHLNLVDDAYPSVLNNTNAMDVVLCRNVLMYFTPIQLRKVIKNLHDALVDGGWLIVSASEASRALFPQFELVNVPGAILYRRSASGVKSDTTTTAARVDTTAGGYRAAAPVSRSAAAPTPLSTSRREDVASSRTRVGQAQSLYEQGRYEEVAQALAGVATRRPADASAFSLLARACANQGNLNDAIAWCDRWIETDKLDADAHYIRAMILLEQGRPDQARSSLQRTIYLHPDFIVAHFTLGNLALDHGNLDEARRHHRNALALLSHQQADAPLAHTDGMTVGALVRTIQSMMPHAS